MRELIIQKLTEIERSENITILHAVESGSRAWGFPSPDSDYDVRFIYVRKPEFYFKLEKTRDVIELPINDMLDINGWDLNKTLRLLHSSNPTLFEWMSSPVVYRQTDFIDHLRPIMDNYFSCKSGLYHYLSMAEVNYRNYLKGDMVRAKKYFYVRRVGAPPENVRYPVWTWYQWEGKRKRMDQRHSGYAKRGTPLVQITFEADPDSFLLSGFDMWHIVLANQYVARNEAEWDMFYENNPHPNQADVEPSWDRIFDLSQYTPDWDCEPEKKSIQATMWQIEICPTLDMDCVIPCFLNLS